MTTARSVIAMLLSCFVVQALAASDRLVAHFVAPSKADPAVKQFDDPSIGIASAGLPMDAPLAVFLPGTGGDQPMRSRCYGRSPDKAIASWGSSTTMCQQ